MKKLLILLLFPITVFSQQSKDGYHDTTISRLVNEKINQYRASKGTTMLSTNDTLLSYADAGTKYKLDKILSGEDKMFYHEQPKEFKNDFYEVICFVPYLKDDYNFNADTIAETILEAYQSSQMHNVIILLPWQINMVTSVYVKYIKYDYPESFPIHLQKRSGWFLFTATQLERSMELMGSKIWDLEYTINN